MSRFLKYKIDHIIFWLLTVFFHGYTQLNLLDKGGAMPFILEIVIRNGLLAVTIYLILLKGIPKLTEGKLLIGVIIISGAVLFYISRKIYMIFS